ncbi:MAG: tRNA (adenosine(37)-N6)-threonylcarbamoyltransferase complex ATPase subunit type 1 TsaE [Verrucomicrobia bacterium]|nr:tRNA (adenosine(37)-N6)-threonylcarbamoyltransferase complex ATPase subunit type 1 TsaE [Verrucomicrobiota bacterium]
MKKLLDKLLYSEEETVEFGRELARSLQEGSIVALQGDLGSGKTTLVKGIVAEIGAITSRNVQSPTFTYMNIYDCEPPIFHFDLYRLKKETEFLEKGFLDFLGENGICLIEWAERIANLLPKGTIYVTLSQISEGKRSVDVYKS